MKFIVYNTYDYIQCYINMFPMLQKYINTKLLNYATQFFLNNLIIANNHKLFL